MKKIGIITFHRANNYGAALQAYALQSFLSRKYCCDVLDYRSASLEKTYHSNKSLKQFAKRIFKTIVSPKSLLKNKNFDHFRKAYLGRNYEKFNTNNKKRPLNQ